MQWLFNVFILTLYFAGYGLVHSWLASLSLKRWLQNRLGAGIMRGYRLAYNIFALVSLLPFFAMQADLPNFTVYAIPTPWRWGMIGGQILALLAAGVAFRQTGPLHFFGLTQLTAPQLTENTPFSTRGFYGYMRHPLYSFSMIFIWLTPQMSFNRLIGYILFSLYFYIGSYFEERKLEAEFGEVYREYQRRVPRLIPLLKFYDKGSVIED